MRLHSYLDIGLSDALPTFKRRLVAFGHELDFELVSATVVVDRPGTAPLFRNTGNTPEGFLEASVNVSDSRRDPVMRRLKRTSVPFLYDQALYVEDGAADLWEEQALYGYRTGISVALHLQDHTHFLLGLDRARPLPTDVNQLTLLMAALQLLAVHAQDAALRFFGVSIPAQPIRVALSPRERECFQWAAAGKTAWETGRILSIAEGSVAKIMLAATQKLDCVSKPQALVKALRLGLIS